MTLSTQAQDELFQLRLKVKIDSRTTACRIAVNHSQDGVTVSGFTHYRQTDAFVKTAAEDVYGTSYVKCDLKVLENLPREFAAVHESVAPVWRTPDNSDPELMETHALYGSVVRVYHQEFDYTFVQLPDGYVGYLATTALTPVSADAYLAWKNTQHAITLVPLKFGAIVVPPGARLMVEDGRVILTDGSSHEVSADQVVIFDPSRSQFVGAVSRRAEEFMDSPYLWGGKSVEGIDCSGFVQTLALQEGIFLPRDASMQCHVGEIVGYLPDCADLLPGDLMFFMDDKAFVFHVGIYLGDHMYLHSAGKTGPTKSSVYPEGENYMTRYAPTFVYARRVHM